MAKKQTLPDDIDSPAEVTSAPVTDVVIPPLAKPKEVQFSVQTFVKHRPGLRAGAMFARWVSMNQPANVKRSFAEWEQIYSEFLVAPAQ